MSVPRRVPRRSLAAAALAAAAPLGAAGSLAAAALLGLALAATPPAAAATGAAAAVPPAAAPAPAPTTTPAPAPPAAAPAALLPIPKVDAGAMEPGVRQQVEAAVRSLAAAPSLPAADAATAYAEAGKTLFLYGMYAAALPCFENADTLARDDYRWPYFAGVSARLSGDLARASTELQRAIAMHSPFPTALVRLGEVELLRHEVDAADRAYTAALAFTDTAPAAHFGLGRVALLRGDARQAATHFEAALAAQPGASVVHAQLAIAYRRLGENAKAEAQAAKHGDKLVVFPDELILQLEAANAGNANRSTVAFQALKEGHYAEAAAGFRQVVTSDPKDATAWLGLGVAEEMIGAEATAAAEQSFRHAIEVDPKDARGHLKLGTLLTLRGERAAGIDQLKTAVGLRPDLKDAHYNLATALAQDGRLAEAVAEGEALLKLAPQDPEARKLLDQLRADLARQSAGRTPAANPPR